MKSYLCDICLHRWEADNNPDYCPKCGDREIRETENE